MLKTVVLKPLRMRIIIVRGSLGPILKYLLLLHVFIRKIGPSSVKAIILISITNELFVYFVFQFRFSDKLDVLLIVLGTLSAMGHGAALPLQFIVFGDLMNSFIDFAKYQTPNVTQPFDLDKQMTKFALYYVYIAVGTIVVAYGQMGLWSLTATRQVKKMRLAFFKSVLKQDIGWFDTTDPGELNSRLTE